MVIPTNLDMDILRTFVTGVDMGSFAKAAERLGRSPSAISLQLRKLEEQTGHELFRKQGRKLVLNEAGEALISYARRLLDLNDQAITAMSAPAMTGWVRLGLPQDFAETWLPEVLAHFSQTYPGVRVEVRVDRNITLEESLNAGDLDLALIWNKIGQKQDNTSIMQLPMVWIGSRSDFVRRPDEHVSLVGFPAPCIFRSAAITALDAAGISWRVTFSSPGLSGVWAAVTAGLGIAVRTPHGISPTLKILDAKGCGLPELPKLGLSVHAAGLQAPPAVQRLSAILHEALMAQFSAAVTTK